MRALAKRPEARFPDAAAFGVALRAALTSRPACVVPERRRWPETERVDLSAFQVPSPTTTIVRAPACDFVVDDRTVATAPLAVQPAPRAPPAFALLQPPCMLAEHDVRAQPALDEPAATAAAVGSRTARATYAGIALLIVIALLQLAIMWRLLHE